MHQGKRLQSIAAFRINEGLTSWPLSPIYLLLWARYRSSTKRSPNFFGTAPGISEDKLDEGEDAACAPIEDEQSAVAILHSGYPSGHSDIADHAAQQRGDVQVSTSRHPPVDDSGAAGCGVAAHVTAFTVPAAEPMVAISVRAFSLDRRRRARLGSPRGRGLFLSPTPLAQT